MTSSLHGQKGNLIIAAFLIQLLMTPLPLARAEARHKSLFDEYPQVIWRRFSDGVELKASIVFPEGHTPSDQAPAFFFFHGGLWKIGDSTEFSPWALNLAQYGFVSVLFEYRQTQNFNVKAADMIEDAEEAWKWMQDNATALGVNRDKIIASGSEAGGIMSLLLAMKEPLPKKGSAAPPAPSAIAVFRAIVDCYSKNSMLLPYFENEKEAKKSSPLNLIRKELPPLFMAVAGKDRFVPCDLALKFAKKYARKKNKLHLLHLNECDQSFYHFNINAPVFEHTLHELLGFLQENGFMETDEEKTSKVMV